MTAVKTENWLDAVPAIEPSASIPMIHPKRGRAVVAAVFPDGSVMLCNAKTTRHVAASALSKWRVDLEDPQGARFALGTLTAGWQTDLDTPWSPRTLERIRWRVLVGTATDTDLLAIARALAKVFP